MKTLVILIGNARGGEQTWESMYKNLLDVYSADLALCFGETKDKSSSLYSRAKYVWELPEYTDWTDYYSSYLNKFWKRSFELGADRGLAGGLNNYKGSGAVVCAFRHFLKNSYKHILNKYDRIILTRSDYYYMYKHPILDNDKIWIVEGEDYGGICDRHHIFPSKYLDEMLGVMEYMDTEQGYSEIASAMVNGGTTNVEMVLLYSFDYYKILEKIVRFPRCQFTVAVPQDTTRWCQASAPVPGMDNLLIKYQAEYDRVIENKKFYTKEA
jgi:hypothetical protein